MIRSKLSLFAGAALLSVSSASFAVPMEGGISFASKEGTNFTFNDEEFDFNGATPNARITEVSGEFADYFSVGDDATFNDFAYDSLGASANGNGITIWEAPSAAMDTNVRFDLNALTRADRDINGDPVDSATVEGVGKLVAGDDMEDAFWNITANEAGGAFSWSSSTAVVTDQVEPPAGVPAPGTLSLFGLALVGLGVAARRKS